MTRCAPGDLFRPSIGQCESRRAHRITMREAAKFARVSKRELRGMSRRERRQYRLAMAAEARAEREERPSRLLPTKPYVNVAYADDEIAAQALEASMMPEEAPPAPVVAVAPVRVPPPLSATPYEFSGIAWNASGNLSFNPRPRLVSRVDWHPSN